MARAVPGNLSASIDIDDGGAIAWTFDIECAATRGVHGLVFKEQKRVGALARNHFGMNFLLDIPRCVVVNGARGKIKLFVSGFDPGIF